MASFVFEMADSVFCIASCTAALLIVSTDSVKAVNCWICSYEGTAGQDSALLANASQPLAGFCANFGYDPDGFPLACLPAGLRCTMWQ